MEGIADDAFFNEVVDLNLLQIICCPLSTLKLLMIDSFQFLYLKITTNEKIYICPI